MHPWRDIMIVVRKERKEGGYDLSSQFVLAKIE